MQKKNHKKQWRTWPFKEYHEPGSHRSHSRGIYFLPLTFFSPLCAFRGWRPQSALRGIDYTIVAVQDAMPYIVPLSKPLLCARQTTCGDPWRHRTSSRERQGGSLLAIGLQKRKKVQKNGTKDPSLVHSRGTYSTDSVRGSACC